MSKVGVYFRSNGKVAWVREEDEHGRNGEEMACMVQRKSGSFLVVLVIPHTLQTFSYNFAAEEREEARQFAEKHVARVAHL